MIRPCKRCNKDILEHYCSPNDDWLCPRRDMNQIFVEHYWPMDNLEYLEWKYEQSQSIKI